MRAVLLIFVALAASCDAWRGDGYTWKHAGPPAQAYTWVHLEACANPGAMDCIDKINSLCNDGTGGYRPYLRGCVWYSFTGAGCTVWSKYSEAAARALVTNARSHFEHEVGPLLADGKTPDGKKGYGHCAGKVHIEAHVQVV